MIHPESDAMTIAQLFTWSNLFVLPFWALMIVLPNWSLTRRIMASYWPFVGLAGLYLYLILGAITPESAQALANPKLADIARFLGEEPAAAVAWTHFLVMDLFVGRWIYWDGQRTGLWTTHSLLLCLFAGPSGLLSHILTRWIVQRFQPSNPEAASTTPDTLIAEPPSS